MESGIKVKQRPHPDHKGLTIKHVESKEYMCPKNGPDGKLLTGVDENAYEIVSLPFEERAEKMKKVKKEREELERVLGVSLVPESSFWTKFFVVLEDEKDFDRLNARDRLVLHFLVANGYVAPSLEAAENDDKFANSMYYLYEKEEETSKLAARKKLINKATAKLEEIEGTPTKLKTVAGYIFGYDPKTDLTPEEAYLKLSEYLTESPDKEKYERAQLFTSVCDKTAEELMTKIILDKAVSKHIVTVRGGIYKRHDFIYGNDFDEALDFLSDPANSGELASLQKEVSGKPVNSKKK
jgi:hypothetical protein